MNSTQSTSIIFELPICFPKQNQQTNLSLILKVTAVALGTISAAVGILIIRRIPALSQIGTKTGWTSLSIGTLLFLAGTVLKQVKNSKSQEVPCQVNNPKIPKNSPELVLPGPETQQFSSGHKSSSLIVDKDGSSTIPLSPPSTLSSAQEMLTPSTQSSSPEMNPSRKSIPQRLFHSVQHQISKFKEPNMSRKNGVYKAGDQKCLTSPQHTGQHEMKFQGGREFDFANHQKIQKDVITFGGGKHLNAEQIHFFPLDYKQVEKEIFLQFPTPSFRTEKKDKGSLLKRAKLAFSSLGKNPSPSSASTNIWRRFETKDMPGFIFFTLQNDSKLDIGYVNIHEILGSATPFIVTKENVILLINPTSQ